MATIQLQEPVYRGAAGPVFFAAGFRPFFIGSGAAAALMLPVWLMVWSGGLEINLPVPPAVWHAHAMVFGFGGAAVGGFLLTAVPNWTNAHHVSGRPLIGLFALWLAGRAAELAAGVLPPLVVAVAELSYLPVLALLLAKPLIAAGKWRNIAFLPILAVLWVADGLVQAEAITGRPLGMAGIYCGIFVLLLLIAVVGGRIVPSFTQNWWRMQGKPVEVKPIAWIEKGGAAAAVVAAAVAQAHFSGTVGAGVVLLAAAAVHGLRLSRWHGAGTYANPILGVLHLGYGWLVVGLALLGLSSLWPGLPASAALHALTAGCIGTMVLAVMSRAALGHSGRPLEVSPAIVVAYGLVSLGTALRVVAPLTDAVGALTIAGGVAWTAAWVLYVAVYLPIVIRPRADGRPG
jgi:uncharacterized protein involved in response to NO